MAKDKKAAFNNEAMEKQLAFAASIQTGNTLRLSGVVSIDEQMQVVGAGDMTVQINQVYDTIEKVLARSNATLANVVEETIYVTDIAALAEAAPVRVARYADCIPPASTAVQITALFFPGAMIEVKVTAVLD